MIVITYSVTPSSSLITAINIYSMYLTAKFSKIVRMERSFDKMDKVIESK